MIDERIFALREEAKANKIPVLRDRSFDLLLALVASKAPKRILEIGTAWGLSGVSMLLSSPSSSLVGIELSDECIKKTKSAYVDFGVSDRANLFTGDAGEIIPMLSGKFDFIFLDGPKGHYYEYLPNLLSLLNKGGVIFADNINFKGYILDENAPKNHKYHTIINSLKNYMKAVTTDKNLLTSVVDIEDGVAITVKLND